MITHLRLDRPPTAVSISDRHRRRLAALADILIPGDSIMPSATAVDVDHQLIDRAAAVRPDLVPALNAVLDAIPDDAAPEDVRRAADAFAEVDPNAFNAFGQLLKGAYFLAPSVLSSIGYPGQEARPLTDDLDTYIELLAEVVERGEFFRPTPDIKE